MIELIAVNWLTFLLSGMISFLFGAIFIMLLMGIGIQKHGTVWSKVSWVCFFGVMICFVSCSSAWGLFLISLVAKFIVIVRE